MIGNGPPPGELAPVKLPEEIAPKPPEVKVPEAPIGQVEQGIVDRIIQDGDPDIVLSDIVKPESSQLAATAQKENFRSQLTDKYNWYLKYYGGLVNRRVMIYEVPNFDGDWTKVSPEDYYAYRLSVMGLKPKQGQNEVSLTQVAAELDRDKAVGFQRSDDLKAVLRTFYGVEDDSRLELNNFIRVSHTRMRELVSNAEFPAAGAFKYGEHVGVLLNAESTKDSKEFSAEVAHEVGHFERMKSGKDDTDKDVKKVRLEEGIVQASARTVAERGGFADAKSLEVYDYETSVATRLAGRLGVDLMNYSHAEIETLMRLSPTLAAISDDPYQLLINNLDTYVRAVSEVDKAGDSIDPKRLNELALQFGQAEGNINELLS